MIAQATALPRVERRSASLLLLLFSVLGSAAYSYGRGQDLNWDQLNYHFYLPWALFHGRMQLDLAPAAIQSYFNPTRYIPFYLLARNVTPVAVGLILGAAHGVNYWLVMLLGWRLTDGRSEIERFWATAAAAVISIASPMALSEIGTSFADILLAPLVLWGLLLLIRNDAAGSRSDKRALLGAALLFGAAASLKLTFAPYALGFVAASTIGSPSWRSRGPTLLSAALGCAAAFILIGGFWYAKLWVTFGNPVFPYFNAFFGSPDYAPTNWHDITFMPKSILEGLEYPFLWTIGEPRDSDQIVWRDIRFILLIAITAISARTLYSRKWPLPHRRLAIFFTVAFFAWLYEFGIQRYAVPLELALGPLFVVILMNIGGDGVLRFGSLIVAALSVLSLRVPNWYHLPWTSSWYGFSRAAASEGPALYIIGAPPMSYAVPFLPESAHTVWIDGIDPLGYRGRFAARLQQDIATMPNIRLLTQLPISPHHFSQLTRYGLYFAGNCRNLEDRAEALAVCDLTRDPAKQQPIEPRAIPAWAALGAPVIFATNHLENGLTDNWSAVEPWGVWGVGSDAALLLRIDPSAGPGPFRLRVQGVPHVNERAPREAISVYASGNPVGDWQFDLTHRNIDRTICIPAAAIYSDRHVEVRFHNAHPRSPAELGLTQDPRPLSIGLKSVELLPADGSCP
jgi:hypothetical protein